MHKITPTKPKTTTRGTWDYFPDCHICNGLRQGRGATAEDLAKLFKEVERANGAKSKIKITG